MNRNTATWFGAAGALTLLGWVVFATTDPAYYDASEISDYLAVVGLTAAFVATGIALVLLWREPPVERGATMLLFAGIGAAAEGMGNLLEDAFNVEAAVWLFFGGGLLMMFSLLAAGVLALTASSPRRWSGLFLLFALPGGMLGFGAVMMGFAWLMFALWIVSEKRAVVGALGAATVPAMLIAVSLYWTDVVG